MNSKRGSVVLVAASLTVAYLTLGCGRHRDAPVSAGTGANQTVAVAQAGASVDPSPGLSKVEPDSQRVDIATVASDSLPPDVAASVADTFVTPGKVVEITAQGSSDVVWIALSDGMGRSEPFAYDPASGTWRAFYRVPMRISTEHVGLSVTARNGINRWRRVWIFLTPEREGATAKSEPAPHS